MSNDKYEGMAIQVLESRDAVRKRPGMYIGGNDKNGMHHLLNEIADNSIDEALNGHADLIEVTLHADGDTVTVKDNGRGIPVDVDPKTNVSSLEIVFTTLHAGAKFETGSYKGSGGLHGVGASVTNFLSEMLTARVYRNEKIYEVKFESGHLTQSLKEVGTYSKFSKQGTGTEITFKPDPIIFPNIRFDAALIAERLEIKTYINPGLKIIFKDELNNLTFEYLHKEGITEYLSEILKEVRTSPVSPVIKIEGELKDKAKANLKYEIVLQWTEDVNEDVRSFVNAIPTHDGGTHENGYKDGMVKAIRTFMETSSAVPKKLDIRADDIREGVKAVVNLFYEGELQFQSQNKVRLNNPEILGMISGAVKNALEQYLFNNSSTADAIVARIVASSRARQASRVAVAKTRKGSSAKKLTLPGKLSDCSSNDPTINELFLVEGDSAGGCLEKFTKVLVASGGSKTMKELSEDWVKGVQYYGYTTNSEGDVEIAPLLHPRVTQANAEMIKVLLDNGEEILCTPCHKFMLRDGTYRRAEDLYEGVSLMPLYQRFSDVSMKPPNNLNNYEQVWKNNAQDWEYTHRLADEYNLRNGKDFLANGGIRHHVDFNKHNNNPDNIQRVTWENHYKIHNDHIKVLWEDPEFRKRMSAQMKERWEDPEFREKMSKLSSAILEERWRDPQYREMMSTLMSDRMKEMWEDPEFRAMRTASALKQWEDPEFREMMSASAKAQWEDPEYRELKSQQGKTQWEDEAYKEYMTKAWREFYDSNEEYRIENARQLDEAQKEYWSVEENRQAQAERVTQFFIDNPEAREEASKVAKEQWEDPELLAWRAKETSKQWTDDFRAKRKATLQKTYYNNTIEGLYQFKTENGLDLEAYREWRTVNKKKAHLMFDTFSDRYFEGNQDAAIEAVLNYNHRVVSVTPCVEREDVYDLEVPNTHNFALAAGVFVHNSAKMGRDRHNQAILPLRGKVLNTEGMSLPQILKNKEIADIIEALGCGVGNSFKIENLRYHKIILMMDADSDGHHIATLLLTFFYRFLPELIKQGHVYLAQPPLYRLTCNKERYWAKTDEERDEIIAKLTKKDSRRKIEISRFKGLGEMMAETLKETTLDPASRTLLQVELPRNEYGSTDEIIADLMGKDASKRYEMIVKNLDLLDELDI